MHHFAQPRSPDRTEFFCPSAAASFLPLRRCIDHPLVPFFVQTPILPPRAISGYLGLNRRRNPLQSRKFSEIHAYFFGFPTRSSFELPAGHAGFAPGRVIE